MKYIIIPLFCFVFLFSTRLVFAQCTSEEECQGKIKEYEQKLTQIKDQKNTLSSQISLMDTQISITTAKIASTRLLVTKTTEEINALGGKISTLNSSLDYLTRVLMLKIVESYKTKSISPLELFLDSQGARVFINRMKYIQIAQRSDQTLALRLQKTKYTYEEQKTLQEEKRSELQQLDKTLQTQQDDLNKQKRQKTTLLTQTNSDEKTYQQLLASAQRQLSSFKSFVTSAGGGKIGANEFGQGSDGNYFSQRDGRWADQRIGYSSEIVLEVGCLITDIAMSMKKNGADMTPASIASNPEYFFANTAYMMRPSQFSWPNGLKYSNISTSDIDGELAAGRYVIVGVYAGKYGTHYVTLIKKDGGEYVMHDPYYGPDKKFSDYYSTGSIFTVGVFRN